VVVGRLLTKLEETGNFYAAETYHQDYMTNNPRQQYIVFNDLPKVSALKRLFGDRFRADPVLVKQPR